MECECEYENENENENDVVSSTQYKAAQSGSREPGK